MSRLFMVWGVCFATALSAQTTSQPFYPSKPMSYDQVQKQEYESQKAQLCVYFSQLVGNFLNIVQRPHDSAHVSGNIADILNNVVNIAISCIKRSGIDLTQEDITNVMQKMEEEFDLYKDVIRAIFVKRVKDLEEVA